MRHRVILLAVTVICCFLAAALLTTTGGHRLPSAAAETLSVSPRHVATLRAHPGTITTTLDLARDKRLQLVHRRHRRRVAVAMPAPTVTPPAAPAADGVNWTAIAECESGDDWSIDTGNGYYGGLQFTEQTWLAYGGGRYAEYANDASEAEQITVAERVYAAVGLTAWPVCGADG